MTEAEQEAAVSKARDLAREFDRIRSVLPGASDSRTRIS